MIIIVDIDGTLCINSKRHEVATDNNGILNWDIFYKYENIINDEPMWETINNVKRFKNQNFKIVIFTARPEVVRTATEHWLNKYDIPYDSLHMRSFEDHKIPAVELKKKMYDMFIDDKVFCAFEDRDDIVELWSSFQIPTFKIEHEYHRTTNKIITKQ
jgi:uncharacterized HAD superfamily protein